MPGKLICHFLEGRHRRFAIAEMAWIQEALEQGFTEASQTLGFTGVMNITVYPEKEAILKESPHFSGGMARTEDWIESQIPPGATGDAVRQTVCHELHHVVRGYTFDRTGDLFLAEAVVAEGMATVFEREQVQGPVFGYSQYDEAVMSEWLKRFRPHAWEVEYDHRSWFFGGGDTHWFGYRLGTWIVRRALENNPQESAASLVRAPVREVFDMAKISLHPALVRF